MPRPSFHDPLAYPPALILLLQSSCLGPPAANPPTAILLPHLSSLRSSCRESPAYAASSLLLNALRSTFDTQSVAHASAPTLYLRSVLRKITFANLRSLKKFDDSTSFLPITAPLPSPPLDVSILFKILCLCREPFPLPHFCLTPFAQPLTHSPVLTLQLLPSAPFRERQPSKRK
jgi:hypothetical protein